MDEAQILEAFPQEQMDLRQSERDRISSSFYDKYQEGHEASVWRNMQRYAEILVNDLSGGRVLWTSFHWDQRYGPVVEVTVDMDAKDALELWLRAEALKRERLGLQASKNGDFHLVIYWSGNNNVTDDELIDYLARISVEADSWPTSLPGSRSVDLVHETRSE
ncbi:hypothetical protein PQ610_02115 [Tardisphaera miroshnichenkoae]